MLPGEGIGPQVTRAALQVLEAVSAVTGIRSEVTTGGDIGCDAEKTGGNPLPEDVVAFCRDVFERSGAILNGPGGSRYVYDLRRQFDLFFKISPIQAHCGLADASPLKTDLLQGLDLLIARENISGLYQGLGDSIIDSDGALITRHAFTYRESEVMRFLNAAARLAATRRGILTVVFKQHGVPTISAMWQKCAQEVARIQGVLCKMVDIDLMAYQLISQPSEFDVIAAPNMFGDVLADLAAALLGSRAMSFSGNFTPLGHGVYQTNHGAAYDLADTDDASPVGQILSLAMMLRHSFGLEAEASAIEQGVQQVWRDGWRTREVMAEGAKLAGTRKMTELITEAAANAAERAQ
ncbi:isocitrate/isopropylmalate family dehydrogenase [Roseimicrobium gellanilyticum]|uniref:isocitrate/isopropylmalate family dehydrogenase n=1 Tax=Roseimicrobium gellanilyticum TaxID=748857 RepID=UPI001B868F02|nr:isocitrate/isopropylmalate family dehydrogenase [Roseimicrobium gellanilyticum]